MRGVDLCTIDTLWCPPRVPKMVFSPCCSEFLMLCSEKILTCAGIGQQYKMLCLHHRAQNWGELPWINSYGCLVTKDWWNTCGSLVSFGNGAGEGGLTDRKYVVFLLRPFLHGLLSFFIPSSRTHPPSIPSFWYFRFYFSMCFFPGLSSLLFPTIPCPLFLSFSSFSGIYSDILFGILSGIYSGIFFGILSCFFLMIYLASILAFFPASLLAFYPAFYLTVYFAILSGIYSEALFLGILSDILFCHSIWHSFWHCFWQILWHPIWHSFWHLFWHFIFHSIWHPFRHSFWDSIWHLFPPDLAVEIRHCPLCSGVRSWSPEVPAEIWSSQLAGRRKKKEKEEQVTLRKSRDSHLAGGEKDRSKPKSTKQADPSLAQMWERFAW